jgi:putative transposase
MPRWPRLAAAGLPMHITQRGNNRGVTFVDDEDFVQYRNLLRHASVRESCAIHAYTLMSNHIHLLLTPAGATGASRLMQRLGGSYVRYFNRRHRRSGTLWEGRFKSALVDSSTYFLACSRYIDMNPVRAGMVAAPGAYPWSSFAHLGLSHSDPLLTLHDVYLALGDTDQKRSRAYRALCRAREHDVAIPNIQATTQLGTVLGDAAFRVAVSRRLQRPVTRMTHGGNRRRMATSVDALHAH